MLRLILAFRCYEAAEISAPNQIFYFFPDLYAIVRSMPVVPMELTILGCYLFWWGLTSSEMVISETVRVVPRARPAILRPSGGVNVEVNTIVSVRTEADPSDL